MDMMHLVLPDQSGQFGYAVATLLVAAAALSGAVAPMIARWFVQRLPSPANDNDEGFASPRPRLRQV